MSTRHPSSPRPRHARPTGFAIALLLTGLLCGPGVQATAAQHIQASRAWIRVLPGDLPAGAYVTLRNDDKRAIQLTGASSTSYAQVMLHLSSISGGASRMTAVDALTIPAHGQVVLAPAGYHLMLMHAVAPVVPGSTIRLTLKFSDGSSLPADFVARPANAMDGGKP